jgi:hypothetical protein
VDIVGGAGRRLPDGMPDNARLDIQVWKLNRNAPSMSAVGGLS